MRFAETAVRLRRAARSNLLVCGSAALRRKPKGFSLASLTRLVQTPSLYKFDTLTSQQPYLCPMQQYSFAICPPPYIIGKVKDMKKELRDALGNRYGSVNSDAHITFNVFRCDEQELSARIKSVQMFCGQVGPLEIGFDHFGEYPNGTFCVAPNVDATLYMRYLMAVFYRTHSAFASRQSNDPHMSIARQLSSHELNVARSLFQMVPELSFDCDRISLRRFNSSRGQYDVVADFVFSGTATKAEQ